MAMLARPLSAYSAFFRASFRPTRAARPTTRPPWCAHAYCGCASAEPLRAAACACKACRASWQPRVTSASCAHIWWLVPECVPPFRIAHGHRRYTRAPSSWRGSTFFPCSCTRSSPNAESAHLPGTSRFAALAEPTPHARMFLRWCATAAVRAASPRCCLPDGIRHQLRRAGIQYAMARVSPRASCISIECEPCAMCVMYGACWL